MHAANQGQALYIQLVTKSIQYFWHMCDSLHPERRNENFSRPESDENQTKKLRDRPLVAN